MEFAAYYNLPFVTFVDTLGMQADIATADSLAMKNVFKLMESYDLLENAKIALVYKKAGRASAIRSLQPSRWGSITATPSRMQKLLCLMMLKGREIEFSAEEKCG